MAGLVLTVAEACNCLYPPRLKRFDNCSIPRIAAIDNRNAHQKENRKFIPSAARIKTSPMAPRLANCTRCLFLRLRMSSSGAAPRMRREKSDKSQANKLPKTLHAIKMGLSPIHMPIPAALTKTKRPSEAIQYQCRHCESSQSIPNTKNPIVTRDRSDL